MTDFRIWALLSALFAGATAVLSKKGVQDVPANLALAIRVFFVLIFAVGIALFTRETRLSSLSGRTWGFLAASAVATGASWLCYFRALQLGPVSQVAPIDKLSFVIAMVLAFAFLGETGSPRVVLGAAVIVVGVLITLS
jgi:transporter family protein